MAEALEEENVKEAEDGKEEVAARLEKEIKVEVEFGVR